MYSHTHTHTHSAPSTHNSDVPRLCNSRHAAGDCSVLVVAWARSDCVAGNAAAADRLRADDRITSTHQTRNILCVARQEIVRAYGTPSASGVMSSVCLSVLHSVCVRLCVCECICGVHWWCAVCWLQSCLNLSYFLDVNFRCVCF